MKALIVGIDGLGDASLKALGLPRLAARLKQCSVQTPTIDNVVSRGWCEIYTGKTAYETGAFYQIPQYDGRHISVTQDTGLRRVKKHVRSSDLLWNRLSNTGLSTGLFCVPTISSPQREASFSVGATGAGKFGNELLPGDYQPDDLFSGLDIENLDLGFRIGYGGFLPNGIGDFERRANKHLADFFYVLSVVCDRKQTDVLFFATRFVTELAYKFIGLLTRAAGHDPASQNLKACVLALAESFDIQLDRFITAADAEHLFIVSDHGLCPFVSHVNTNALLAELGETKREASRFLMKSVSRRIRALAAKEPRPRTYPTFALGAGPSFSSGYTDLIYLNDKRFGGHAMSTAESVDYAKSLVERLSRHCHDNEYQEFKGFEILNLPKYTQPLSDPTAKVALPMLRVKLAPGCFNSGRTYFSPTRSNIPRFDKSMFRIGFHGEYSGCKSEDTIAAYKGAASPIDMSSLPAIYTSITRVLGAT